MTRHQPRQHSLPLQFENAGTAVDALIGLAIGDQQVRRLLGVLPMPEPEKIEARADQAMGEFLTLFTMRRSPRRILPREA